jgi:hypothetical protein
MLCTVSVRAVTVAGVPLPDIVRTHGSRLEPASCGVRRTLWIEHYAAALYLPRGVSVRSVADPHTPKAVLLQIIDARYLPGEIPGKWAHVLEREMRPRAFTRVRRAYRDLTSGDVVSLIYEPGHGTAMRLNGTLIALVRGHALVRAILATWAGEEPVFSKLDQLADEHRC